ncbi:hypothetical protein HANVADRAFT_68475 [Hanseniaspora valbyensis NRRL Y-1626]|uniref:tRNA-splicing endonuclease subunit Sen54 N-terminal domain-containing protein n=1 Tax=Hanseniaspora valbyensis NRRL Y-1626 TaxID=766949 RepID=A0A1B7TEM8_9ASCO|nr:hypothetical protein HANVADRAFT_68475 [Hanseniaspora valbyensis NRRL Y-1626]
MSNIILDEDLGKDEVELNDNDDIILQEETFLINQLIKDQYSKKNNNSSLNSSELDTLLYKNSINKLYHILNTQSYTINLNNTINVKYNTTLKEGMINGKNLNGFIKANNGKSINTDLHKLNPFELMYNLERLTPITVYNKDTLISVENFYNEIASKHLEDYKIYSHLKRLGYLITFNWWIDEYEVERNRVNSTFFSIKKYTKSNIIQKIKHYYNEIKYNFVNKFQYMVIQSTKQFQTFLESKNNIQTKNCPKNIKDLYSSHNNKINEKNTEYIFKYDLVNLYKSKLSKTQTLKHPHLPDFQLIASKGIPHLADIPFNQLDYKFRFLTEELEKQNEGNYDPFDSNTFVKYFDSKKGEWCELNRVDFLTKKNKNKPIKKKIPLLKSKKIKMGVRKDLI